MLIVGFSRLVRRRPVRDNRWLRLEGTRFSPARLQYAASKR